MWVAEALRVFGKGKRICCRDDIGISRNADSPPALSSSSFFLLKKKKKENRKGEEPCRIVLMMI